MIGSGSVEDYNQEIRGEIVSNFASAAGVNENLVTLVVSAGSVVLTVTISSPTSAAAEAVAAAITPALTSAEAASAFMPSGFTVESTPEIAIATQDSSGVFQIVIAPPPPSLADGGGGATIGIIVAGVAGVAVVGIMAAYYLRQRAKRARIGALSAEARADGHFPVQLVQSQLAA